MKFIAVASENNEVFDVVVGQVLCGLDIEENIYMDPETGEFVQEMLDGYLLKGNFPSPERSIAELCEFDWVQVEEFPEISPPKVPVE